jgi:hypothetical protein
MPNKSKSNPPTGGGLKSREARAYLGNISTPTLWRLVKAGRLRPCRQLRHAIFAKSELDRFINAGMT